VFLNVLELCFDAGHLDKKSDATRRDLSLSAIDRESQLHKASRRNRVHISRVEGSSIVRDR
jgi:hypothetical protein